MCAIPLDVSEDCLLDRWAYPSNDDLLMSMLISEGVSESLQSRYELVQDNDLSARWGGRGGVGGLFFYAGNAFRNY